MMEIDCYSVKRTESVMNLMELKKKLKYIMDQYIYVDGEYCVNISALTRKRLIREYEGLDDIKKNMSLLPVEMDTIQPVTTESFEDSVTVPIERHGRGDRGLEPERSVCGFIVPNPNEKKTDYLDVGSVYGASRSLSNVIEQNREHDRMMVREYLAVFDVAMDEIINLMRKDSLMRFYVSSEYDVLTKDKKLLK